MKLSKDYILAFLLGMVTCYYIAPPTPTVELDDVRRQQIVYEVIELLEDADYNLLDAKQQLAGRSRKGWLSW